MYTWISKILSRSFFFVDFNIEISEVTWVAILNLEEQNKYGFFGQIFHNVIQNKLIGFKGLYD